MDQPDPGAGPALAGDDPSLSSSRRAVYEEAARVLAEATLLALSSSAGTPPQPIERVSIALGVLQDAILALDSKYLLLEAEGAAVASSLAARAAAAAATLAGATAPPDDDDAATTAAHSSLSAAITLYETRFRDLVVLPTLKRLSGGSAAKKPAAEKAVVAAKAVGALLAKSANPNKQPAFAQYLPSALRPAAAEGSSSSSATKKGQLDCVGAATAVLAAVQAVAREDEAEGATHAALAGARLAFSDDHSWLVFGRRAAEEEEEEQDGQGAAREPHSPASSSSSLLGPAWGAEEEEEDDDDDQQEGQEEQRQPAGPSKRRRRRLSFLLRGGGRHQRDASPGAAARRLAPLPSEEEHRPRRRRHFLHRHHRHHQDSSSPLSAVEATDARMLKPGEARGWLYALPPQLAEEAGRPGLGASPRQLPAILAAALVPEDVCPLRPPKSAAPSIPPRGSEDAADAMRAAQLLLLERLAPLPEGVFVGGGGVASTLPARMPFYSTLFRWGLAAEELELERLERAADTRDPKKVRVALRRNAQQHPPPPSQDLFRLALRLSDGRQWQPASCALFGRLQRLQSALCGSEGVELVLGKRRAASAAAAPGKPSSLDPSILQLAEALLADALAAVRPAVDVLRAYSGAAAAAGGGQKAAVRDAPLIRGPRDALEHLADAFHGMARLLVATETVPSNGDEGVGRGAASEEEQQGAGATGLATLEDGEAPAAAGAPAPAPKPPVAATMSFSAPASAQDRMRADLEAALAAARPPPATTGALPPTPEAAAAEPEPAPPAAAAPDHQAPSTWQLGPERSTWLVPALLLVDSALEYWGADSPDADAATVDHFLHAASAFSPAAVRAAVEGARPQLQSDRLRAMAGGELEAVAAAAACAGSEGGAAAAAAVAAAKSALLMPRKRARRG
jgi:hypothetical protein